MCAPQSGKLGTVLRSLGFTPTEADVEEMQGKAGATVNFDALLGFISAAKAKTIKEPDVVEARRFSIRTAMASSRRCALGHPWVCGLQRLRR